MKAQITKKVDPLEVFQVLGASDDATPKALKQTAREVGVSPEVVEFMEKLPPDVMEPSDVVAAATDSHNNDAKVELDLPQEEDIKPELTVGDITDGAENTLPAE